MTQVIGQTPPEGMAVPDMNKLIQDAGPEFVMGMDVPRLWATGAQVFMGPATTLIVFREQNLMGASGDVEMKAAIKNVASLAIPTEVIREFNRILTEQLAAIDG